MALRLGIGDTLTLCKGAIDYCSRTVHDEPEDARILIADMCLMRSHLQCLSKQLGDEHKFAASRPDIAPVIQRSLAPIQRDLSEMKKLLDQGKRKQSLHIVDQVRHHVLYKAKLDAFREKMPVHRKSISEMGTLIEAQTYSERRASVVRLGSFIEEQEGQQGMEGHWSREVLGVLEEQDNGGEGEIMTEVIESLKVGLVARGHEEEKVDDRIGEIQSAMMLHHVVIYDKDEPAAKGPEALQLERFQF